MNEKLIDLLYHEIGRRIKSSRETKGLTQEAVATAVGISRASISNIEQGRQQTPIAVLYIIANHIGAEVREFFPSLTELNILEGKKRSELNAILVQRNDFSRETLEKISQIIDKPNT